MANPKEPKKKEIEGVYVKTVRGIKSFRRAGFAFDEQGIGFALDALSKEQLKALKEESNLIVDHVTFAEGDELPNTLASLAGQALQVKV